jgi:sugar phosphate isomerase/epimerase
MKISFMTFACPTWPLARVVDAAIRHGYHGIEFRCDANHAHGVEVWTSPQERREVQSALAGGGLECCCLATSLQFVNERAVEEAPPRIQLAADLGCPGLRVFCGPLPEGMDMTEAIPRVGEQLRYVADMAEQAGVQLWLETHDSMSRGADAASAVRAADHRAVGINYDNMHPHRMGEPLETTVEALRGLVRHAHLHDALNRPEVVVIKPIDQGELPMEPMLRALQTMGYDGYLSGEWFNDQYGPEPEEALAAYIRDMRALVQRVGGRVAPM